VLKILNIEAENFMSYKTLQLDLRARGPVLVVGENDDSPVASSNGSGKSSISEAILWTLFGVTARKMQADGVIKYDESNCVCKVDVNLDGETHTITRSRKRGGPDVLLFDGQTLGSSVKETQSVMCERFKIAPVVAVNAIVFGQGLTQFADATDSERGQMLKSLLWLDIITKAREEARKEARSWNSRKEEKTRSLVSSEAVYAQMKKNLDDWNSMASSLNDSVKEEAEAFAHAVDSRPEGAFSLVWESTFLQTRINELEKAIVSESTALRFLKRDLTTLLAEVERIDKLVKCPTCLQEVSGQHKKEVTQTLRENIVTKREELTIGRRHLESLEKELSVLKEEKSAIQLPLSEDVYWRRVTEASQRLKSCIKKMKSFSKHKNQIKHNLTTLKSEIRDCLIEINIIATEETKCSFWDKGFSDKGIPQLVLGKAVESLNLYAATYSKILLDDVVPVFSLQRETSTGDKFGLAVKVEKDGKDVYKNMSGGEKQRVNLTISFALFDLLRTQVTPVNLIVLDEVFVNLDKVGVERVYKLVQTLPVETILVITHQIELSDLFSETIIVKKKNGTSYIT